MANPSSQGPNKIPHDGGNAAFKKDLRARGVSNSCCAREGFALRALPERTHHYGGELFPKINRAKRRQRLAR